MARNAIKDTEKITVDALKKRMSKRAPKEEINDITYRYAIEKAERLGTIEIKDNIVYVKHESDQ